MVTLPIMPELEEILACLKPGMSGVCSRVLTHRMVSELGSATL
jgi:hypothetical protein